MKAILFSFSLILLLNYTSGSNNYSYKTRKVCTTKQEKDMGFNFRHVCLHYDSWDVDKNEFIETMNSYFRINEKHSIKTNGIFFNGCSNERYMADIQPKSSMWIGNSARIQNPGIFNHYNPKLVVTLVAYAKDILSNFKNNDHIIQWDLYNKPENGGYKNKIMRLFEQIFEWSRDFRPAHPITIGVRNISLKKLTEFQIQNSNIISYQNYSGPIEYQNEIDALNIYNRSLICPEYKVQSINSLFGNTIQIIKNGNIGVIIGRFVPGKFGTKYAWKEPITDRSEPKLWLYQILRKDGKPYKQEEVELIRSLTIKD